VYNSRTFQAFPGPMPFSRTFQDVYEPCKLPPPKDTDALLADALLESVVSTDIKPKQNTDINGRSYTLQ